MTNTSSDELCPDCGGTADKPLGRKRIPGTNKFERRWDYRCPNSIHEGTTKPLVWAHDAKTAKPVILVRKPVVVPINHPGFRCGRTIYDMQGKTVGFDHINHPGFRCGRTIYDMQGKTVGFVEKMLYVRSKTDTEKVLVIQAVIVDIENRSKIVFWEGRLVMTTKKSSKKGKLPEVNEKGFFQLSHDVTIAGKEFSAGAWMKLLWASDTNKTWLVRPKFHKDSAALKVRSAIFAKQ